MLIRAITSKGWYKMTDRTDWRKHLEYCKQLHQKTMNAHDPNIHCLADRSVSSRHSRTRIRACTIPRFNRSAELRLPEYVGRISRPISSISDNSWPYFDKPDELPIDEGMELTDVNGVVISADILVVVMVIAGGGDKFRFCGNCCNLFKLDPDMGIAVTVTSLSFDSMSINASIVYCLSCLLWYFAFKLVAWL